MGIQIGLVSIQGTTFVTVGALHRVPLQSLIGDWEGNAWGDGKFPGFAAVSTVALLRYQSSIAENPAVGKVFSQAADELTKSLGVQIDTFQRALNGAAGASA
jgi:hypothetical protein